MKKIAIVLFMGGLISCGANNSTKNNSLPAQQLEIQSTKLDEDIDSDFDGILDRVEIARGSNPYIADYPKLEFSVSSLEFSKSVRYKNQGKSKFTYLKEMIGQFEYENYFNRKTQLLELDLNTVESNEVRCLSKFDEKNIKTINSEKLKMFYQIKVVDNDFVEEVSNISAIIDGAITFQLKESLRSKKDNEQKRKFISELSLPAFNTAKKCMRIDNMNFNYNFGGIQLKASKVKKEVEKNLAHIIILTKSKPFVLSVDPNHFNIKTLLEHLNLKPKFSTGGELVRLNSLSNEFHTDKLVDFSKDKSLKLSRWFFNSSNNSQILDPLEAGEFYSLAFLSIKDLLKHSKKKKLEKIFLEIGQKSFNSIQNLQVGDRVELRLDYSERLNELKNESYTTAGYLILRLPFGAIGSQSINRGCSVQVYNEINQVSYKKLSNYLITEKDFRLILNNREIIPLKEENELVYSFELGQNDLNESVLNFRIPEKSPNEFEYLRHTVKKDISASQRCNNGDVITNSKDTLKLKLTRELGYKGSMTVFGPTR